ERREPASEDRRGPRRCAEPAEPRVDRERERELHGGPQSVRRHPGGRAEQRERAHRQGGGLPPERETAGGAELSRLGAWGAARKVVGPPEPREHPAGAR